MASKRIGKSMVDWATFAQRVPKEQYEFFRAFKGKSDMFVSRVAKYPENLQPIDFEFYKSRIPNKALVAEFEKAYKAVAVPFPKDKNNMKAALDVEEKEAMEESKRTVEKAKGVIASCKTVLEKIDLVPGPEEMTLDMYAYYFPEQALNPWKKQTFWPHTKSYQPENDPHLIN